jgi:polyisoprenoid-binding protein YceI
MIVKNLLVVIFSGLISLSAEASEWSIDQVHSSIGFSVKHMMVSTVRGSFGKYESKITFDPAKPNAIQAELTIEANSINTGVEKRDTHLKSADFFDVEKYPKITFKSKKIESLGNSRYRVTGDLTIKDVTKEIVLEGEGFGSTYKNPWGSTVTAVSARSSINREDFGLKWNVALESGGVLVSKEVVLEIELELVKGA